MLEEGRLLYNLEGCTVKAARAGAQVGVETEH